MKKLLALTLTVCLCLGLGMTALAADLPEGWTPADGARTAIPEGWTPADGARTDLPDGWTPADGARDDLPAEEVDVPIPARYTAIVTIDGTEVDTTGIPGAPAGYVPMRVLTEAAGGVVDYYPDENQALFFLDNVRFTVDFATMALQVEREDVDAEVYLNPAGYTFLPVSLLNGQGQITVDDNLELDVERYDIKTSASDPMTKLNNDIQEACEMSMVSPVAQEMLDYLEFDMDNYVQLVARAPMANIQCFTVFIAEVAEGKMDAAKADFKAFQDHEASAFEHYLEDRFEVAKAGQIVESPDGAHLMLIISENNEAGIELFNAAYPAAQ